jgi:polyhydroxyalkanoate synthesis repressor PhaR
MMRARQGAHLNYLDGGDMRHIRRYANRKLYDVADSGYVTLSGLAGAIQGGEEIEVIDRETGRDITGLVLAQVVETLQKEAPHLKAESLVALIREHGLSAKAAVEQSGPTAA